MSAPDVDHFGAASTRAELQRLAERVRRVEAQPPATAPAMRLVFDDGGAAPDVLLSRVMRLIEASEERQNQQFAKVILPLMTGQSKLEKDFRELRENTQGFGLVAFGKPQTRGVAD